MTVILAKGSGLHCTAEQGVQGRKKTLWHTVIPGVGKQKAATRWYFQHQSHTAQQFRIRSVAV